MGLGGHSGDHLGNSAGKQAGVGWKLGGSDDGKPRIHTNIDNESIFDATAIQKQDIVRISNVQRLVRPLPPC